MRGRLLLHRRDTHSGDVIHADLGTSGASAAGRSGFAQRTAGPEMGWLTADVPRSWMSWSLGPGFTVSQVPGDGIGAVFGIELAQDVSHV